MTIQKFLALLAIFLLTLSSQLAVAGELQQPKADGWIGEQNNGYIGLARPGASTELKALVIKVNAQRRTIYAKMATKQRISLGKLEAIAGERNIAKTSSGQLVKKSSGDWVKKK